MSRLLSAVALSALLPVTTSGPAVDPPSSLRPDEIPGKVILSHEHRRVLECRAQTARDFRCDPQTELVRAGTRVTIRPVDAEGKLIEDNGRQPVTVAFENIVGVTEATAELAPGVWELAWPGLDATARFGVAESDEFRVRLRTVSGACERLARRCVLEPDKVDKSAQIPANHRVGH